MTEDAARDAQTEAEALTAAIARRFGDLVSAVILHGSLAVGGYTPGRSDIDLLAVVERPLHEGERRALQETVLRLRGRRGGLDWRVVTRAAASRPDRTPAMEMYVGLHAGHAPEILGRAQEGDLTVELSVARAHGRSLVGAAPPEVLGPVPAEWVVAYGDEVLARWQDLTDDAESAELMVLTACRIWRFAAEGVHCAKAEAGRWALARDPALLAVHAALRQRSGEADVDIEPSAIGHLLRVVRRDLAPRIGPARGADGG